MLLIVETTFYLQRLVQHFKTLALQLDSKVVGKPFKRHQSDTNCKSTNLILAEHQYSGATTIQTKLSLEASISSSKIPFFSIVLIFWWSSKLTVIQRTMFNKNIPKNPRVMLLSSLFLAIWYPTSIQKMIVVPKKNRPYKMLLWTLENLWSWFICIWICGKKSRDNDLFPPYLNHGTLERLGSDFDLCLQWEVLSISTGIAMSEDLSKNDIFVTIAKTDKTAMSTKFPSIFVRPYLLTLRTST